MMAMVRKVTPNKIHHQEDETEDDFEQTNPLLEQIRKSVRGALSGTGMAVP